MLAFIYNFITWAYIVSFWIYMIFVQHCVCEICDVLSFIYFHCCEVFRSEYITMYWCTLPFRSTLRRQQEWGLLWFCVFSGRTLAPLKLHEDHRTKVKWKHLFLTLYLVGRILRWSPVFLVSPWCRCLA